MRSFFRIRRENSPRCAWALKCRNRFDFCAYFCHQTKLPCQFLRYLVLFGLTAVKIATGEIYQSFESNDETRAAFLDISKAFDKVWHEGLLFKLKCNGISGNLYSFISDDISDHKQRVVLNGTKSSWLLIELGVP